MKAAYKGIVCLIAVFALAAAAGLAAAPTQTVNVAAGGSQTVNLGSFTDGDGLTLSWSTDFSTPVSGVLAGPSGYEKVITATWLETEIIDIPHTGAYTLTLSNAGSTAASVSLTWETTPFSPGGFFDDLVTLVLIIAVVIIVIIVVVVVLVVVVGGKKKQQAAMAGAPAGIVTPMTPGMCPVCGTQTDTSAQFCQKCGARFR